MLRVIFVENCRPYGVLSTASSSLGKSARYSVISRSYRRPANPQVEVSNSDGTPDFRSMTVKLLKEECRERKLKVSGRKLELIERLINYEANRRNKLGSIDKQADEQMDMNAKMGIAANGNPLKETVLRYTDMRMGSSQDTTSTDNMPLDKTSKHTVTIDDTITSHKPELNPVITKSTPTSIKARNENVRPIKVESTTLKDDVLQTNKTAQTKQIDGTEPDANDRKGNADNTTSKLREILSTSAIFAGLVYWWSHDTKDTR